MNDEVVKDSAVLQAAQTHAEKAAERIADAAKKHTKAGELKMPGWQVVGALATAAKSWTKEAETEKRAWNQFTEGVKRTETALTAADDTTATTINSVTSLLHWSSAHATKVRRFHGLRTTS